MKKIIAKSLCVIFLTQAITPGIVKAAQTSTNQPSLSHPTQDLPQENKSLLALLATGAFSTVLFTTLLTCYCVAAANHN